jgi:hypothetical protein
MKSPPGELYLSGLAAAGPNLGLGFGAGQVFARDRRAAWSIEMDAVFEPFDDLLLTEGTGTFAQVRGGFKTSLCPAECRHPTFRMGMTWFRTTAEVSTLAASPGDYVGAYVGVGYEWDIGSNFSTGPELSASFVSRERDFEVEILPRLSWHFIWKL